MNPFDTFDENPFNAFDKQSTSVTEDLKIGLSQVGNRVDRAWSGLAGALAGVFSQEEADQVFKNLQERIKARDQFADAEGKEQGVLGKSISAVGTLPMQVLTFPLSPFETSQDFIDKGESLGTAQKAIGIESAGNFVGGLAGPMGAGLAAKVATGAGLNVAQDVATRGALQAVAQQEETQQAYQPTLEDAAVAGIIGGGFGAITTSKKQPVKKETTKLDSKLDEIIQQKKVAEEQLNQGKLNPFDEFDEVPSLPDYKAPEQALPTIDKVALPDELNVRDYEVTQPKEEFPTISELEPKAPIEYSKTSIPELQGMEKLQIEKQDNIRSDTPEALDFFKDKELRVRNEFSDAVVPNPFESNLKQIKVDMSTGRISGDVLFKRTDGKTGLDVPGVIDTLIKESPKNQEILSKIRDFVKDIPAEVLPQDTLRDGALAAYNRADQRMRFATNGLNARTVLHESVHAATQRFMDVYTNHPAVKTIDSIYEKLKNNKDAQQYYGMFDRYEFVAELKSNGEFQQWLRSHNDKGVKVPESKSVWRQFVNSVKQMFGIKDVSALDAALRATDTVISTYHGNRTLIDAKWNKSYEKFLNKNVLESNAREVNPENRIDELFKGTALETLTKDQIVKDTPVEKAIQDSINDKDGGEVFAFYSGGQLASRIRRSAAIQHVYDWFHNADKRVGVHENEIIKPIEKEIQGLIKDKKSLEELATVLRKEMFSKTRLNETDLRGAGVSEKAIEAYTKLRFAFDDSLRIQNESRALLGKDPITALEHYLSSRRQGPWHLKITDDTGRVLWYVTESTKIGAQKALKAINKEGIYKSDIRFVPELRTKENLPSATYKDMIDILGKDDDRIADIKAAYEQALEIEGRAFLGQERHSLNKQNIRGFEGDKSWKTNNDRDLLISQVQYLKNAYTWSEKQLAVAKAKSLLSDENFVTQQPNNANYIRQYIRNDLGMGELKEISGLETKIAKQLGISRQSMSNVIGETKNFFYLKQLGGYNPVFWATQLIQPIFTSPEHARLSSVDGLKHNPIKTSALAVNDTFGWFFHRFGAPDTMTVIGRQAMDYAIDSGLVDINPLNDIKDLSHSRSRSLIERIFSQPLMETEMFSRMNAYMGYIHHLTQAGLVGPEMFKKAEDLTNMTMVEYKHSERPLMYSKMGLIGESAATLQTFKMNQLNQLYAYSKDAADYIKSGGKSGSMKPLSIMLGIQMAVGGAMGMFAVSTADAILDFLKGVPGIKNLIGDFGVKKFILQNMNDLVAFGGLSKVTGVDFSSRMDASNVIDPSLLKNIAPFFGEISNIGSELGNYALNPTSSEQRDKTIRQLTPAGLQGSVEKILPSYQPNAQGITPMAKDLSKGEYKRDDFDKFVRGIGGKSLSESRAGDINFIASKEEVFLNDKKASLKKKFDRAVREGKSKETIQEIVKDYSQYGDPTVLAEGLQGMALNRATTAIQRLQGINPQSLDQVRKYQRIQEYKNDQQ